jgi:co-chaperonin GroES (HSP10)
MRQAEMSRATPSEEWITAAEVPDPDPLPTVVGWKLLIRPVAIKTKTKGGILLPEQYVADVQYLTTVGRVLAMGELAYKHKDFEVQEERDVEVLKYDPETKEPKTVVEKQLVGVPRPWCQIGQYVCYGKFAGTKFLYKGVKLLLLEDRLVDMVVPDPAFIDPQFNISQG